MRNYVLRRTALFVPTAIGVSLFIFAMLHVIPGDYAASLLLGRESAMATEEDFKRVRESWAWTALCRSSTSTGRAIF
jgi:ABC-type dipeptide/oligopeptide/nickel transport system permease component